MFTISEFTNNKSLITLQVTPVELQLVLLAVEIATMTIKVEEQVVMELDMAAGAMMEAIRVVMPVAVAVVIKEVINHLVDMVEIAAAAVFKILIVVVEVAAAVIEEAQLNSVLSGTFLLFFR